MSIDSTIEQYMSASYFDLFSDKIGTSAVTGYDWTDTTQETINSPVTVEVEASVRPGFVLKIQQAIGHN
jgi:hypothetical protein